MAITHCDGLMGKKSDLSSIGNPCIENKFVTILCHAWTAMGKKGTLPSNPVMAGLR